MEKPKVIHFSEDFSLQEITEYLKDKTDILYYTRTLKEGKEFHIVKNDENAFFQLNKLQAEMFKYYKNNIDIVPLLKDIKIKGNSNFSITENLNPALINKLKTDLNNILKK